MQLMIAVTLILIGLTFIFQNIVPFIGLSVQAAGSIYMALVWIAGILAIATAMLLIKDALKMTEEDNN